MLKTTLSLFLFAGLLPAQTTSGQVSGQVSTPDNPPHNFTFITSGIAMPGAGPGTIALEAHRFSLNAGKPVTGAPYSADEVTEHTQTLADGNRIVNTTTTKIYRDSQGRTRTETTLPAIAAGPAPPTMITIADPVAQVTYLLNPTDKTARKIAIKQLQVSDNKTSLAAPALPPPPPLAAGAGPVFFSTAALPKADAKTEDLGTQVFDGVSATGSRTTETIPAGAIGNDQPIQTVSERWFSPDLQIVLKATNTDPRIGQTTQTVNNLSRSEPDPSLFQVPADYTVSDADTPGPNQVFVHRAQ